MTHVSTTPSWLTQDEIAERLRKGLPIELPEIAPGDATPEIESKREIPAAWIASLVEWPKGIVTLPIVIRNAIVTGELQLQYIDFQSNVRMERCRFVDAVDLSFSEFSKAAVFDSGNFEKRVRLNGVRTKADLEFTGTQFDGKLECQDATIGRDLNAQGAIFQKCEFEGTSIRGLALFKDDHSKPAHFHGEANFELLQVGGGLDLAGAVFDSDVHFTAASVKNFADFTDVTCRGKAQFDGVAIIGDAKFDRAQFIPTTADAKDALIRFPGVRVAGQAVFDESVFGGDVRFDQTRFEAEAFFESAKFSGSVRFDGTSFAGPARFNKVSFTPSSSESRIDFRGARASDIEFKGVSFLRGKISFQDANFKIVYFRDTVTEKPPVQTSAQFPCVGTGELDLRGFTYDRIFIAWYEALAILNPYDVQPYRQMERAFRTVGENRDADRVYLRQRWRGLRYDWNPPRKRWLNAAAGLIYGVVARFGVRPWRLAVISIALLICSIAIFIEPNAVTSTKDSGCITHSLNKREALGVSLNYFLPVQVPVAACWVPTNEKALALGAQPISFALWASVLKLLGWIFVPLGVAALGGLLRRDPSK